MVLIVLLTSISCVGWRLDYCQIFRYLFNGLRLLSVHNYDLYGTLVGYICRKAKYRKTHAYLIQLTATETFLSPVQICQ